MAHRIAFYVPPCYQLLDLAGPLDAFDAANVAAGVQLYTWRVISRAGGLMTSGAGLPIDTKPADDARLDTLMVIGGAIDGMRHEDEMATVLRLAERVARIASVCTGAFLLAGAGLLDGRRATTHWSRARELQESFPAVLVEADRIYVADGSVWTSAGITAGIDLALALIEADHGVELARRVSRELVVYHRRAGWAVAVLSVVADGARVRSDADRARLRTRAPVGTAADRAVGRRSEAQPAPVRACVPEGDRGDSRQGHRAVAH